MSALITFTRFDGISGHIFSIQPDGNQERQLTNAPGIQAHSTWSPNGRILFYSQIDNNGSSVRSLDIITGTSRLISGSLTWSMVPHVSPDSRRIAFTSNNDGNDEIYEARGVRGGRFGMRQLTFTDGLVQNVGPNYSPDSQQILFASNRETVDPLTQQDLWVMPASGGVAARLSNNLNNRESRGWSPDGRKIVTQTVTDGVGQIVVMDADGRNQQVITQIPPTAPLFAPSKIFPEMRGAVTPAWSPDGRWIAFASNHEGNYDLYAVRPDGTDLHRILATPEQELSVGWGVQI
jgi:TolB protein